MDELDLTEKTPRTFDEDDLAHEVSREPVAVTPARTARGTKSHTAMPSPPPIPRRAATVKPLVGGSTIPPSKLIPFLPPPEPQSPVPGSFPVVRASSAALPPPTPAPRRATSQHLVARPTSRGNDESVTAPRPTSSLPVVSRSTINAPLARGSIAPTSVRRSDEVDIPIDVGPFAADVPHAGTPMTDDKHVPLPPIADAGEVADDVDCSSARPRRNVAAIVGIAAGAALVATTIALMIRGSGTKPAPAPVPAALATVPAEAPASPPPPPPVPPSAPPAVEVAATTSAAAAAPAAVEPADDEPAHADLPISSQPDGAVVTLIANGDATVVGRTPVTASVDPTLTYDVVFALRDHPTLITHIDASKVHELAIDLTPRPAPAPTRRRAKVAKPVAPKPAPRTR